MGFKTAPLPGAVTEGDPVNTFSVKGSQWTKKSFNSKPGFTIRCLNVGSFVERNFMLDTESERDE
ncbi:hypothetical protein, partial [Salmonella sp. s51228]|uniref:hypothetical protein n=1 Tax=Salmonella sp. s51228 TaxID=3159652 RepID=UPI0039800E1D